VGVGGLLECSAVVGVFLYHEHARAWARAWHAEYAHTQTITSFSLSLARALPFVRSRALTHSLARAVGMMRDAVLENVSVRGLFVAHVSGRVCGAARQSLAVDSLFPRGAAIPCAAGVPTPEALRHAH